MTARGRKAANSGDGELPSVFDLSFVSLSVIILSMLVLLTSISSHDGRRWRAALGSLLGAFGNHSQPAGLRREDGADAGVFNAVQQDALTGAIEEAVRRSGLRGFAEATIVDGTATLRLTENLAFPSGKREISPRAFPLLDEVSAIALAAGRGVRVVGHCDATASRTEIDNWALSAMRAASVARYLDNAGGLGRGRVTFTGRADAEPVSTNATAEGRARNRRVEILFPRQRAAGGGT